MKLSLVVSTLGRHEQLARLCRSLADQTMKDFEVVVIDQNPDDRLGGILDAAAGSLSVRHIRTPDERGLSRGRNRGWPLAQADVILFPDDDCWYPPDLFERAIGIMEQRRVDVLSGRACDLHGRSINGRYAPAATAITRQNVFTTQIEWMAFFRKAALEQVAGYDPAIGLGADTPWQSCEGPDLILRVLEAGLSAWFDPAICGHHEELNVVSPDAAMRAKGRAYGRGFGYVLSKHNYGTLKASYWAGRAAFNTCRALVTGNTAQARYYGSVALGRVEGYLARVL